MIKVKHIVSTIMIIIFIIFEGYTTYIICNNYETKSFNEIVSTNLGLIVPALIVNILIVIVGMFILLQYLGENWNKKVF